MARTAAGSGSARQHNFAMIPRAEIPRSVLNRSHTVKTAFNSGYLIPVFADEALPGDSFKLRTHSLVRMTTPLFPIMDNMYLDVFFFAVPIRLIWDNWQKFNGEQRNPGDSIAFSTPVFNPFTPTTNSLSDYLGIPCRGIQYGLAPNNNPVVSFWHRAYNLIWNEWFRDENLQNSVVVDTDDGPDDIADYVLLRRGKRHDYFSSALPFVQKGNAVSLPLGSTAPVLSDGTAWTMHTTNDATVRTQQYGGTFGSGAADTHASGGAFNGVDGNIIHNNTGMYASLATATAATINDIRTAFQIQRLLERDARGGTRYTEIIRSHFGVVSPDQRLQRPEYLGGGSCRINVHPVARVTGATGSADQSPIANLGGFVTGSLAGNGFNKSFVEHCVVLGLVNVRADLTYQQGLNRMFSRRTRYDFYWPAFSHIGEQSILNKEIFVNNDANDNAVFGYQERYAEYRYKPSIVTGTMSSNAATPLDGWHLALKFAALPSLNSVFIPDQPPMSRVLAVQNQPEFFGDFWFDYKCARPMPTFSVPGMVDHF